MPLSAVFFDFDGLIMDTEYAEVLAWRETFAARGLEYPDWLWMETIGRNNESLVLHPADFAAESLGHPAMRHEILDDFRERRGQMTHLERVFPGVHERIEEAEGMGLGLAVVSSSRRNWVEERLARVGLLGRFGAHFCGYEGIPAKPDPALYQAALGHYGVAGSGVIVFEDSPNGITAAKAAGTWCVAVPNELTSQLDLSHADWQVESLGHITIAEIATRLP